MNNLNDFSLGLIGWPVQHSLSPFIHSQFLSYFNFSGSYNLIPVSPETFKKKILSFSRNKFVGLNVTLPYKKEIINYCKKLDFTAKSASAVNTLVFRESFIEGFNTDIFGLKVLMRNLPKPYFVLGKGGAATAIIAAFGKESVFLLGRKTKLSKLELSKEATIINATPLGWGDNDIFPFDIPYGWSFVDLNYNRSWKWRNQLSNYVVTGERMLVAQAAESFKLWTGLIPPEYLKNRILDSIREGKQDEI